MSELDRNLPAGIGMPGDGLRIDASAPAPASGLIEEVLREMMFRKGGARNQYGGLSEIQVGRAPGAADDRGGEAENRQSERERPEIGKYPNTDKQTLKTGDTYTINVVGGDRHETLIMPNGNTLKAVSIGDREPRPDEPRFSCELQAGNASVVFKDGQAAIVDSNGQRELKPPESNNFKVSTESGDVQFTTRDGITTITYPNGDHVTMTHRSGIVEVSRTVDGREVRDRPEDRLTNFIPGLVNK